MTARMPPKEQTALFVCSAVSHAGLQRTVNEDRHFTRRQDDGSLLLAVADGMGGAPGGGQASALAISVFAATSKKRLLLPSCLGRLVRAAHQTITDYAAAHDGMQGMGATLTAVLVRKHILFWAHVGDSRLSLLRGRRLRQLTNDHRFLLRLLQENGTSVVPPRRHPLFAVLDQCLGGPQIEPEFGCARFVPGDRLLLATDGLHDAVAPETTRNLLAAPDPPTQKTERLLQAALTADAGDDITLVVAEYARTDCGIPRRRSYADG
jgi:protein phosphatase